MRFVTATPHAAVRVPKRGTLTLGGSIDVPTLDGAVTIKVPPETQSGRVFRLREKGIKPVRGGTSGGGGGPPRF